MASIPLSGRVLVMVRMQLVQIIFPEGHYYLDTIQFFSTDISEICVCMCVFLDLFTIHSNKNEIEALSHGSHLDQHKYSYYFQVYIYYLCV